MEVSFSPARWAYLKRFDSLSKGERYKGLTHGVDESVDHWSVNLQVHNNFIYAGLNAPPINIQSRISTIIGAGINPAQNCKVVSNNITRFQN